MGCGAPWGPWTVGCPTRIPAKAWVSAHATYSFHADGPILAMDIPQACRETPAKAGWIPKTR